MGGLRAFTVFAVFLWAVALGATLVTQNGERLEGEVKAISERGIVIRTNQGVRTIPPEEVYELELDRPWIIAFGDGSRKVGRLQVKEGQWYLNSEPLNFYSVFGFAPAKDVSARVEGRTISSPSTRDTENNNGSGSSVVSDEAGGEPREGRHEKSRQPENSAATENQNLQGPSGTEGTDGSVKVVQNNVERKALDTTSHVNESGLPIAEVRVAEKQLKGEILSITPYYLLLQSDGVFTKLPLSKIEVFKTDVPWTVVDVDGKRFTGSLQNEAGIWKLDETPLNMDRVVALIPRLDLREKRVSVPAKKELLEKTSSASLPTNSSSGGNVPLPSPKTSREVDRQNRRSAQSALGKGSQEVAPCIEPDLLEGASKVDVAGWSPEVAVKTAGDFAKSGDWAEAVRIYKQIVEYNPDAAQAWIRLGHAYRKLAASCSNEGKAELALEYYSRAVTAFERAVSQSQRTRDRKEASYWKSRTEKERIWGPEAVEAFEKGYGAYQGGDYARAAEFFQRAAEANAKWPDAFYWWGRALLELGRREEAIEAFQKALAADPGFKPAQERLLKLGVVAEGLSLEALLQEAYQKEKAGDLTGARELYIEATKRFPDSFKAYYRLGLLARRLGFWEEALNALNRALELAEGNNAKRVRYWLGRLNKDAMYGIQAVDAFEKAYGAYSSGRYEEAARLFAQAARLAPNWVDARYWQARALVKLGRVEEARTLLQQVLQQDPGHEGARVLLKSLE